MRTIRLAVGAAAATVCIWLAVRHLNWSESAMLLHRAAPSWLLIALVALGADYLVRIARWWLMLRALGPVRFRAAAGPLLAGMALNNVLPFRAGDIVRTTAFSRELGMPVSRILGTMLLERLLDLGALIIVFAVGAALFVRQSIPAPIMQAAIAVAIACGTALFVFLMIPHRPARSPRWFAEVVDALRTMRGTRLLLPLVILSFVAWLLEGVVFGAVAVSLGMPGAPAWFAMAAGTLGTLVPGTPGYLGTFDYFTMVGFTLAGIAREPALICALLVHIILWVPVTTAGLSWLLLSKGREAWHPAPKAAEAVS
jgi:uncharacterized membrane protein YbhN (UPF0104 family)